ncbi:hypothetical protein HYH03_009644 [Edaphochlamys debaryana]|uniref:Protein kinase domain-containing protein n=1 Tax=Edaphochlamys debaryana TaxID=47281 RepID=A0A835XXR1_9CHLO|nr:hypothetical protein HYH03_009644 [Edaphochlamys debaryana]|eukprot:KAG2492153.1 hypothetical protein HYH03_009644 [Edaphochlamys debaryana]
MSVTKQARPPPPDFGVRGHYIVMEMLGEGGTGQTWLCQDVRTARRVAIKFMPRPLAKVLVPMVAQEIQLQAQLSEGHLGLVHVQSALLTRSHLGLVMEYVDGGTLTQYVMARGKSRLGGLFLDEEEAKYFFRQLINSVEYLHKSHVAHRDLKMCNVVLTSQRPPTLKLCDFGFAKGWGEDSQMHTRIGTPVYMSPQLLNSRADGRAYSGTAADVWACGVMLFAMLLGMFPYDHIDHPDPNTSEAHIEVYMEQMKAGGVDWHKAPRVTQHVKLISESCRDLLGKMLDLDEHKRITIPAIREHPWFKAPLPKHLDAPLTELESRQAAVQAAVEAATEEQLKRRNKAVLDLVTAAGVPYGTTPIVNGTPGRTPIAAIIETAEAEAAAASLDGSRHTPSGGGTASGGGAAPAPSPNGPAASLRAAAIVAAATAAAEAGGGSAPGTPRGTPGTPRGTPGGGAGAGEDRSSGSPARSAGGTPVGGSVKGPEEVVMVDLTAAARRTKSGALLGPVPVDDDDDGISDARSISGAPDTPGPGVPSLSGGPEESGPGVPSLSVTAEEPCAGGKPCPSACEACTVSQDAPVEAGAVGAAASTAEVAEKGGVAAMEAGAAAATANGGFTPVASGKEACADVAASTDVVLDVAGTAAPAAGKDAGGASPSPFATTAAPQAGNAPVVEVTAQANGNGQAPPAGAAVKAQA